MFYLQIRKGDLPAFIVKIGQKKKDNSLCGLSTDNLYNKYNLDTLLFYLFTFLPLIGLFTFMHTTPIRV